MSESLGQRLRYNAWANAILWRAMRTKGAPDASFRAFQHVLETEMTWSSRIIGREGANVPLWGPLSIEQCELWLGTARQQLQAVATEHQADGYQRTFRYRNSTGQEFENPVGEVLEHMLLHSSQYRGEAAGLSNAAGVQMPDLDYIIWIRNGQPAAEE